MELFVLVLVRDFRTLQCLDAFDCCQPGWCAVVVESGVNPVRIDGDNIPSIVGSEGCSQFLLTDRVRPEIGTVVTEAQYVHNSVVLCHRRQTRRVSLSLLALEGVKQSAVQDRLKPAPQTL